MGCAGAMRSLDNGIVMPSRPSNPTPLDHSGTWFCRTGWSCSICSPYVSGPHEARSLAARPVGSQCKLSAREGSADERGEHGLERPLEVDPELHQ